VVNLSVGFFDPAILLNLSVPILLITVIWQKMLFSYKEEWKIVTGNGVL